MASVKLPDGSVREVADGSSVMSVAESIGPRLAKAAVAGKVDGKVVYEAKGLKVGLFTDAAAALAQSGAAPASA